MEIGDGCKDAEVKAYGLGPRALQEKQKSR